MACSSSMPTLMRQANTNPATASTREAMMSSVLLTLRGMAVVKKSSASQLAIVVGAALVVSAADTALALRVLEHVRSVRPDLPVVVRTFDDTDLDRLREAGASEVVPEIMEGSLMLASHALLLLGVPLNRVLRRIRDTREQRYGMLRGFFHGATDEAEDSAHKGQKVLHSVLIAPGAAAVGRSLGELGPGLQEVEVRAMRRGGIHSESPPLDKRIAEGDVLVLFGSEEQCAAAQIVLMQGVGSAV